MWPIHKNEKRFTFFDCKYLLSILTKNIMFVHCIRHRTGENDLIKPKTNKQIFMTERIVLCHRNKWLWVTLIFLICSLILLLFRWWMFGGRRRRRREKKSSIFCWLCAFSIYISVEKKSFNVMASNIDIIFYVTSVYCEFVELLLIFLLWWLNEYIIIYVKCIFFLNALNFEISIPNSIYKIIDL